MPVRKPHYYWDSNIFIAWLQDEKRKPGEMEGVFELATKFDRRHSQEIESAKGSQVANIVRHTTTAEVLAWLEAAGCRWQEGSQP